MASQNEFEYTFMFMENRVEEISVQRDMELYVASRSNSPVSVTIDNPGGSGSFLSSPTSFSLAPDQVIMSSVSQSARQLTGLDNKAIRVRSTGGDILVYVFNRNLYSSDGFTVFRADKTGREYYALAYTPVYNTQIGLISLEDGVTLVEITVAAGPATITWAGVEYSSGRSFNIRLTNKYQSVLLKSLGDLTGEKNTYNHNHPDISF